MINLSIFITSIKTKLIITKIQLLLNRFIASLTLRAKVKQIKNL